MVPLTWLANELSRTGVGMKAGQMVSTGTLTGMLAPKPGETFRRRLRPVRLGRPSPSPEFYFVNTIALSRTEP